MTEPAPSTGRGWPRRALDSLGLALALALSGWFVWHALSADWSAIGSAPPGLAVIGLAVSSLLYALLGACLAFSWTQVVVAMGGSIRNQWRIHATTQALKYLPGNVAHLAGRHALATRSGLSQKLLLSAAPAEAALLVSAAGLICLVSTPLIWPLVEAVLPSIRWMLAGLGASGLLAGGVVVLIYSNRKKISDLIPANGPRRTALLRAFATHLVFFAGCGLVGFVLLYTLTGTLISGADTARLTAALALAWLAGFLVPGAPAGLGVRETVILALVAPMHGAGAATGLAALYRMATLFGDMSLAVTVLVASRTYLAGSRNVVTQ